MQGTTIRGVLAVLVLVACPLAHAGKLTMKGDGGGPAETLEFNDRGFVRLGNEGMPMGMILRDGKAYFVGELEGKPAAVDLMAAARKAEAAGDAQERSVPEEVVKSIERTPRKETVAGIVGNVWIVTWDKGGTTRTEEVVLSDDPRLAPVVKGMKTFDTGLTGGAPIDTTLMGKAIQAGTFPLRSAETTVASADFAPTPESRFELGAEPVDDMEVMVGIMFGAMMAPLGEAMEGMGEALSGAMGEAMSPSDDTEGTEVADAGDSDGPSQRKGVIDPALAGSAKMRAPPDEGATPEKNEPVAGSGTQGDGAVSGAQGGGSQGGGSAQGGSGKGGEAAASDPKDSFRGGKPR